MTILLKGALAQGYSTDLWTTSRIAAVIRKRFRVTYHPDHVGRLLHQLEWTPQKPEMRALERDEAEIERWKRVEWPRVKKRQAAGCPSRLCRRVAFLLLLVPGVRKTRAPRGQTPIIRCHYRRDKISVISGLSVSPARRRLGLYWRFLRHKNFTHPQVCDFLRQLLRHLRGGAGVPGRYE